MSRKKPIVVKPCIDCSAESVIASRSLCQPCYKRWLKRTPKAERPKVDRSTWKREAVTLSKCHPPERDRGGGLCGTCYQKQYRTRNKEKLKVQGNNNRLIRLFGITSEDKERMRMEQEGKCAICGNKPYVGGKDLHVDHCHKTGKVRGLLCARCNWYLGKIDSDPLIINRIIEYRRRS